MNVLFVDHEDSFSFNIVQELLRLGVAVEVVSFRDLPVSLSAWDGVVLSPGPGHPEDYPASLALIQQWGGRIPLVGICLGHQMLGLALGGTIRPSRRILHGKTTPVFHTCAPPFEGVPSGFRAMRYNSLVVDLAPGHVTARDHLGEVMALRCEDRGFLGLQFHPESILTEHRDRLFRNLQGWIGSWRWKSGQPVRRLSGH